MRTANHIPWVKSGLALMCAGLVAQAGEALRFFASRVSIPERGEVTGYVLVLGANRFFFIPPAGWQVKCDANQGMVRLTAPDYAASISVRVLPADQLAPAEPVAESLQKGLLKRLPGARVSSVQPCFLSGLEGWAFDLDQPTGPAAKLASRICLVPFSGGVVELSLTTAAPKLKEQSVALGVLMASFEVEAADQGQEPPAPARK